LLVLISRLCAVCFLFSVLMRCLFDLGWKISFEQVQIRSMTMTLASSTLQIQRHEYSGDFNIFIYSGDFNIVMLVIFVGIGTLPIYDAVSLFTNSSFLFLVNLNMYCIDVIYQFEWMNIVYFYKKNAMLKMEYINFYICMHLIIDSMVFFFGSDLILWYKYTFNNNGVIGHISRIYGVNEWRSSQKKCTYLIPLIIYYFLNFNK